MTNFEKVKDIILDMGFVISHEDLKEELVVIDDDERGIKNLVIDCEDPILILEQVIIPMTQDSLESYKRLLQINRTLVFLFLLVCVFCDFYHQPTNMEVHRDCVCFHQIYLHRK